LLQNWGDEGGDEQSKATILFDILAEMLLVWWCSTFYMKFVPFGKLNMPMRYVVVIELPHDHDHDSPYSLYAYYA
jgi:hypothetical protein